MSWPAKEIGLEPAFSVDTEGLMQRELAKLQDKLSEARVRHLAIGASVRSPERMTPTSSLLGAADRSPLMMGSLRATSEGAAPATLSPSLVPPAMFSSISSPPRSAAAAAAAGTSFSAAEIMQAASEAIDADDAKRSPAASVRVTRNGSIYIDRSSERSPLAAARATMSASPSSYSSSMSPPTLVMPLSSSAAAASLLSSTPPTLEMPPPPPPPLTPAQLASVPVAANYDEQIASLRALTAAARSPTLATRNGMLTSPSVSSAGIASIKDRYFSESLRRSQHVAATDAASVSARTPIASAPAAAALPSPLVHRSLGLNPNGSGTIVDLAMKEAKTSVGGSGPEKKDYAETTGGDSSIQIEFTIDASDAAGANFSSQAMTQANFGATFARGLREQLATSGASPDLLKMIRTTKVESVRVVDGLEMQIERLGSTVQKSVDETLLLMSSLQDETSAHVDSKVAAMEGTLAQKIESTQSAVETQGQQLDTQVHAIESKMDLKASLTAQSISKVSSELNQVRNTMDDATRQSNQRVESIASKVLALENVLKRESGIDEKFRQGVVTMLHEIRISKNLERAPLPPKPADHRPGLLSRAVVPLSMRSTAVVPTPLGGSSSRNGGNGTFGNSDRAFQRRQAALDLEEMGHPDLLHAVLARVRKELQRRAITSIDLFNRCGGTGDGSLRGGAKAFARRGSTTVQGGNSVTRQKNGKSFLPAGSTRSKVEKSFMPRNGLPDSIVTPIMRPLGVTPRQLSRGLESIGVKLFGGERDVLFAAMDMNLDGRVTLDEMRSLLFQGNNTLSPTSRSASPRAPRSARNRGLDMSRPVLHFENTAQSSSSAARAPRSASRHPVFSPSTSGAGAGSTDVGSASRSRRTGGSTASSTGGWTRTALGGTSFALRLGGSRRGGGGALDADEWAEGAPAVRRAGSSPVFKTTRSARSPKLTRSGRGKDHAVEFMRILQNDPPTFRRFKGIMQNYKSRPECVFLFIPKEISLSLSLPLSPSFLIFMKLTPSPSFPHYSYRMTIGEVSAQVRDLLGNNDPELWARFQSFLPSLR